ncbi:MAG TPA: hypothetical protein VE869_07810 [Gemmatimonas sp.]|nr:hypothetical protein [Gemmatimonas sp.]
MTSPASRHRRGVALIVVLWAILLMATITAAASGAARGSADVASARRAGSVARLMAESGIVAASARVDAALRAAGSDSAARWDVLDGLDPNSPSASSTGAAPLAADTLGDGVFAVTVVDASARLDMNVAGQDGWSALLRSVTSSGEARDVAERITAYLGAPPAGRTSVDDIDAAAAAARDSMITRLLGRDIPRGTGSPVRRRLETVDDLLAIPGIDVRLIARVAPFLTADGNGYVNRRAAPPPVLAAASGQLVDHPVRLVLVSRGWRLGHPLTREIQAVYDVADDGLRLVRWRERDR